MNVPGRFGVKFNCPVAPGARRSVSAFLHGPPHSAAKNIVSGSALRTVRSTRVPSGMRSNGPGLLGAWPSSPNSWVTTGGALSGAGIPPRDFPDERHGENAAAQRARTLGVVVRRRGAKLRRRGCRSVRRRARRQRRQRTALRIDGSASRHRYDANAPRSMTLVRLSCFSRFDFWRAAASDTGPCTTPRPPRPAPVSRRDDRPAAVPALGSEIDDPVGRLDHVEIVLDHEHGVAAIDQPVQHVEQHAHVLEVQTRSSARRECRTCDRCLASKARSRA